jgi:hypothetical protein
MRKKSELTIVERAIQTVPEFNQRLEKLWLHPHLHFIVPAVGHSLKGEWKHIGKSWKYLYPVHQLGITFKGKFMDSIKRSLKKAGHLNAFKKHISEAREKNWVVHGEPPLAKAEHVIRYLGQYTHRVAISNQRIILPARFPQAL